MVRLSGCVGHDQRREQPLDLAIDVQTAPAGGDHRHIGHERRMLAIEWATAHAMLAVVHDQQGQAGA